MAFFYNGTCGNPKDCMSGINLIIDSHDSSGQALLLDIINYW